MFVTGNNLFSLPPNLLRAQEQDCLYSLEAFHHIPNLSRLDLSFNKLSAGQLLSHLRIFSGLHALKYLHPAGAFGDETRRDQELLLEGLSTIFASSKLDQLLTLNLERNQLTRIADSRLFCDLPSFRDLSLGGNQLTDLLELEDCNPSLRFVIFLTG